MRFRSVLRLDRANKLYRLCRFIWRRGKGPGVGGNNYDAELTVALCPPWQAVFRREHNGWIVRLFGLRLHHEKSYGGVIV